MITHKEFYNWLEGYLYGKLENKHIDITPIIQKMSEVKDIHSDVTSFMKWRENIKPKTIEINNKEQLND
jgi:succinate dehydrogenase/fumarate reductase-like Fe-S protein